MTPSPHFIGAAVEVAFDAAPPFPRRPSCPDRWVWEGQTYEVAEVESAWSDMERRGRMAANMRPAHAEQARRRGSFGVGRFYFRVRTRDGRVFDLYFDRAAAGKPGAGWTLFQEWTGTGGGCIFPREGSLTRTKRRENCDGL